MKKIVLWTLPVFITLIFVSSFFLKDEGKPIEAEVISAPLMAQDNYGVEIKPPVIVQSNLESLGDSAKILISEDYSIIHGTNGGEAKDLSDLLWSEFKLDLFYYKDTRAETVRIGTFIVAEGDNHLAIN